MIQRYPIRDKNPTEKKMAARKWFAENLSGRMWLDVANGNRVVSEKTRRIGIIWIIYIYPLAHFKKK